MGLGTRGPQKSTLKGKKADKKNSTGAELQFKGGESSETTLIKRKKKDGLCVFNGRTKHYGGKDMTTLGRAGGEAISEK